MNYPVLVGPYLYMYVALFRSRLFTLIVDCNSVYVCMFIYMCVCVCVCVGYVNRKTFVWSNELVLHLMLSYKYGLLHEPVAVGCCC